MLAEQLHKPSEKVDENQPSSCAPAASLDHLLSTDSASCLLREAAEHNIPLLAVGCWLLAFGFWLLAFGGWRLAVGGWRLAVGCMSS
ncbi:hypothetical protein [Endozoicomonas euniceicola]|uniref:Uncharacterized protein n=1 Tax=Endozoicomonas euniceicola TaxID=1234143 RepID=A0ABY6GMN0_9GAMM|nr:hypothetical protein [Endozoicomonas euniceicola]UYM13985.1 hypothetical protein NX720_13795 [Endozoicomonas euniceicola]